MTRFLVLWAAYAALGFAIMLAGQLLVVTAPPDIQAAMTRAWFLTAVVLALPVAMANHRLR